VDVRIGMHLTAVRLSDGSTGAAATFSSCNPFCSKTDRDFGPLTPSRLKGAFVMDIIESRKETGLIFSLRMAVLNALSASLITGKDYSIAINTDPLDYVGLTAKRRITIVGAFQSYIRKLALSGCRLSVLEINQETLPDDQRGYYIPAEDYKSVIPESDVVIITGQTLVNGTIDDLLSAASESSQVIVTGPSSGILPDVLFRNKVSIMGAVRITNHDKLFDVVGEGGTGFHLFEYCAEKICILR
jgi:uncharacterized protein (DUF4213/DUF364 family)